VNNRRHAVRVSGYIPPIEVSSDTASDDVSAAITAFKAKHGPSAVVEVIDGRAVDGLCEACLLPIFEDEPRICDCTDVGLKFHERCAVILDSASFKPTTGRTAYQGLTAAFKNAENMRRDADRE
jgi:hypothetical protein